MEKKEGKPKSNARPVTPLVKLKDKEDLIQKNNASR